MKNAGGAELDSGGRNLCRQWPKSSGHGNVVDFWLVTLPMALPPKLFLHFSLNQAILSKKFCGSNAIGNVAKQKSAALSRADDSGHY